MSYAEAFREEERCKEKVYASFESEMSELSAREADAVNHFNSGSFEDQAAFMDAGAMWRAIEERQAKQQQVRALFDKPYFAHIRLRDEDDGELMDCLLSDNENLEERLTVLDAPNMFIIPFKQDERRPVFTAAFHCYQAKTDEVIPVRVRDERQGGVHDNLFSPKLIRDVEVLRRKLGSIVTYLPQEAGEAHIDADELLARRLEENRDDVKLRNIIATLQLQQSDIIRADIDTSFIVQGCAGSGKSQCLIHRLFFFRDTLRDVGWNKVLLITPSQLFRNYSAELIRRYRLGSVANVSLAAFYKKLLESFDSRFSDRQYRFELSEEYLPDAYLQQVYAAEQIERIDAEIDKAIAGYAAEGYRLTGEATPEGAVDITAINALVTKLSELIVQFDETEKLLSDDAEYQKHRREIDALEKRLVPLRKKLDSHITKGDKLREEREWFDKLFAAYERTREDFETEAKRDADLTAKLRTELKECVQKIERSRETAKPSALLSDYARLRDSVLDRLEMRSDDARFDAEYKTLVDALHRESNAALLAFTKRQSPQKWLDKHTESMTVNAAHIKEAADEIELVSLFIEEHNDWFKEHSLEDAESLRKAYREQLRSAHYYLGRIESAVFEREVWNALAPLKTECGIETVVTEQVDNGQKKLSRILYKSDLLFYLRIYDKLHKNRRLPDYNLICIDEGQDLHRADYDMIKALYPKAVLNIFGDTEQVLHEACGINDWCAETGVDKLYIMNNNYRNTAAIADFCNKTFGSDMVYYGEISRGKEPKRLSSGEQAGEALLKTGAVAIVKNKEMFEGLRTMIRDEALQNRLVYIDTRAESVPENAVPCYSIFAAKGLEFKSALVYSKEMTKKQKLVACTRAMEVLFYYE